MELVSLHKHNGGRFVLEPLRRDFAIFYFIFLSQQILTNAYASSVLYVRPLLRISYFLDATFFPPNVAPPVGTRVVIRLQKAVALRMCRDVACGVSRAFVFPFVFFFLLEILIGFIIHYPPARSRWFALPCTSAIMYVLPVAPPPPVSVAS